MLKRAKRFAEEIGGNYVQWKRSTDAVGVKR